MADINSKINQIKQAVYGEEVRDAIVSSLTDINNEVDEISETINNISVGSAGKSAYQIAVDNGFIGTESEWLATLKGSDGTDGTDGAPGADGVGISKIDFNSSTADGGNNVITITKTDGKSSTFTVKNGSKGDKGDTGAPGADYVLTTADKQEIANLVNADTDIIPGYVRTAAGNIAEKMIEIGRAHV